ncbi:hypothetical protein CHCC14820_2799 [Bacillus paralicheniformis]|uniref:Uncharacterized protein n=1 Tax=Bacillus paralicheniformis TaxID=1648923 RepID=A0AAW6KES5_9BACI|nr:hypothetical protein [Bacillus paralicheniformis]MDE1454115.1 hypothetical protein [Bacillus paralicheniformis]TWM36980.1 hypothetical protein CHCC14820_2799 [Bacillus paralicheniformis]
MVNKPKSFEEFFYSKTLDICEIEKVNNYASEHKGDYTPFNGFMFCPECQNAELTFIRKTSIRRAHLKKKPSSTHLDGCSYNYNYASKKLITRYVDNLTYEQVQDRLNAIMNLLFKTKNKESSLSNNQKTSIKPKNNPLLLPDIKKETHDLKALRKKRLSGWIDESDGTDLHVFYGKVKLEVVEKEKINDEGEKYSYYLLTLKTMNKKGEWKFRTQIYRGGIKDKLDINKVYQVAMIGKLNFKWKWWQIDLINKSAIRFQEVES